MGRHRQSVASQGNTIEQYAMPVPLPQPERIGLTVHHPLGVASLDWRTYGERQLEGTADQVVDIAAATRVEIQHDGTMAVVTPGLADESMGTMVQGTGMFPVDT
ncbi:hypothetical protein NDU88_009932 [Pleurodeles waltl]|uniref:Uncharacterized protein n=1 Tax=Pleurodeles waltl TaxID=8319 RepID=A0AAV7RZP8_PLEWA|nr:hypothetical protein NDU88_009932 [Pleurodeles waltl]